MPPLDRFLEFVRKVVQENLPDDARITSVERNLPKQPNCVVVKISSRRPEPGYPAYRRSFAIFEDDPALQEHPCEVIKAALRKAWGM